MARATLRALVLGAAAAALLAPASAGAQPAPLLGPTPLVMRDERLVEVSVHAVPFEPGEAAMTGDGIEALEALGEALATDCFLNAQAVGHAEPALADGPEPMAAHRLARSRAERVRAALMEHGLPEGSIAAFWDWQLAVREPRTTLWVFQLREGADCLGRRLEPAPVVVALVPRAPPEPEPLAALEAQEPPRPHPSEEPATAAVHEPTLADEPAPMVPSGPLQPAPPPPPAIAEESPGPGAPEAGESLPPVAEPAPAPPVAAPEPPAAALPSPPPAPPGVVPASLEQLVAAEPPPVEFPITTIAARLRARPPGAETTLPEGRAAAPTVVPVPPDAPLGPGALATEPEAPEPPLAMAVPSADPSPQAAAPSGRSEVAAIPAPGAPADVEIVFDLNSSYLPRGSVPQLRRLVERMPRDRGWKVVLTASVSAVEDRIPDRAQAERYNRWLAERRLGRVADWLEQNSEVRDLELVRSFAAADASRRVTVAVAPAS